MKTPNNNIKRKDVNDDYESDSSLDSDSESSSDEIVTPPAANQPATPILDFNSPVPVKSPSTVVDLDSCLKSEEEKLKKQDNGMSSPSKAKVKELPFLPIFAKKALPLEDEVNLESLTFLTDLKKLEKNDFVTKYTKYLTDKVNSLEESFEDQKRDFFTKKIEFLKQDEDDFKLLKDAINKLEQYSLLVQENIDQHFDDFVNFIKNNSNRQIHFFLLLENYCGSMEESERKRANSNTSTARIGVARYLAPSLIKSITEKINEAVLLANVLLAKEQLLKSSKDKVLSITQENIKNLIESLTSKEFNKEKQGFDFEIAKEVKISGSGGVSLFGNEFFQKSSKKFSIFFDSKSDNLALCYKTGEKSEWEYIKKETNRDAVLALIIEDEKIKEIINSKAELACTKVPFHSQSSAPLQEDVKSFQTESQELRNVAPKPDQSAPKRKVDSNLVSSLRSAVKPKPDKYRFHVNLERLINYIEEGQISARKENIKISKQQHEGQGFSFEISKENVSVTYAIFVSKKDGSIILANKKGGDWENCDKVNSFFGLKSQKYVDLEEIIENSLRSEQLSQIMEETKKVIEMPTTLSDLPTFDSPPSLLTARKDPQKNHEIVESPADIIENQSSNESSSFPEAPIINLETTRLTPPYSAQSKDYNPREQILKGAKQREVEDGIFNFFRKSKSEELANFNERCSAIINVFDEGLDSDGVRIFANAFQAEVRGEGISFYASTPSKGAEAELKKREFGLFVKDGELIFCRKKGEASKWEVLSQGDCIANMQSIIDNNLPLRRAIEGKLNSQLSVVDSLNSAVAAASVTTPELVVKKRHDVFSPIANPSLEPAPTLTARKDLQEIEIAHKDYVLPSSAVSASPSPSPTSPQAENLINITVSANMFDKLALNSVFSGKLRGNKVRTIDGVYSASQKDVSSASPMPALRQADPVQVTQTLLDIIAIAVAEINKNLKQEENQVDEESLKDMIQYAKDHGGFSNKLTKKQNGEQDLKSSYTKENLLEGDPRLPTWRRLSAKIQKMNEEAGIYSGREAGDNIQGRKVLNVGLRAVFAFDILADEKGGNEKAAHDIMNRNLGQSQENFAARVQANNIRLSAARKQREQEAESPMSP